MISLFPNSYCQPKLAMSPLPGKLIIFKRRQVNALNLADKFLFFGLRDKVLAINESIWNLCRDLKKIQISMYSGHTIMMPCPAQS